MRLLSAAAEDRLRSGDAGITARRDKHMTATVDNAEADLRRANAELRRQLNECRAELAARNSEYGERIEHQSATIDVLKVMSASPGADPDRPARRR
jgi:hypothetical protein